MFKKILIANRGEIACRVAASARRMGVLTVAVYADADADARHVHACDEAVHVGGSAPRDSYLQWPRILDAARATGAQAVHPGYGFLSENPDFARACAAAGLVFIGPPPAAMAAMGSKSAAKALMQAAGVPLVPGYHGADNDPALLAGEAARIGYPVLIKASAGGGGKGMRRVDRAEDFAAALAACQREARTSFGDDQVLVERYVTRPRHIEIQVFADSHGHCVHLFERDCSVQRRHQKVLEEAPAPGLRPERRAEMGAAAVAAARAVGYVGAGTVEFIAEPTADGDLRFFFMEMNTRLQVEHPVTEAITGVDLVAWQLRVAAGQALPLQQADLRIHGHAIEARICAEQPEAGFLPSTGTLQVAHWPAHRAFERSADGVLPRLDSGFGAGDTITPHYDPMIAKLIVSGEDRAQALARLDVALAQVRLLGLHTNVAFLRRVVASRSFAEADLDTALIEREHAACFDAPGLPTAEGLAAAVARCLADEATDSGRAAATPWARRDGFRLHGAARREWRFESAGRLLRVGLLRWPDRLELQLPDAGEPLAFSWRAGVADAKADAEVDAKAGTDDGAASGLDLTLDGRRLAVHVHRYGRHFGVFAAAGSALLTLVDPQAARTAGAEAGRLSAPMPGKVVAYLVAAGARVGAGQALAVIEAMKMEHTLHAPHDGRVAELLYGIGDAVAEGDELLRLALD